MAEMTIKDVAQAMGEIQKERNYLQSCIRDDTPEPIRTMLQAEVDARNTMLADIETEVKRVEEEFAARLIPVPDGAAKYIAGQ